MKRGFKIIMAVIALLSLSISTVGAAEYLYDDFSEGTANMVTSTLEGASYIEESDGDFHFISFDNPTDGAFIHKLNASKKSLSGGEILEFDWRVDERYASNAYVISEFCFGAIGDTRCKFSLNFCEAGITPEDDVWYTGLVVINEDYTNARFYRKVKDSNEPFVFVRLTGRAEDREEDAGWRMYNRQSKVSMSNIQIWDNTFAKAGSFEMDGTPITELSELQSGILTAKTTVTCGDIVEIASQEDPTATVLSTVKVMPLVVVYDENMRMISCTVDDELQIGVGDNEITVQVDTSAFIDRIGNGHIGLYLWDDFEGICPLANATKLQ